jgi:hypothetical protein
MRRNQLFKVDPPLKFLEEFIKVFGLKDMNDSRKFSRDTLYNFNSLEKFEKYRDDLKKYYIPCKYDKYVNNLNEKKMVTILRQLVRTQSYKVISHEKYIDGQKTLLYSLENDVPVDDYINYNLKVIEF